MRSATKADRAIYTELCKIIDSSGKDVRVKIHKSIELGKGIRYLAIGLFTAVAVFYAIVLLSVIMHLVGAPPFYGFWRATFIELYIKLFYATGGFLVLYDVGIACWFVFEISCFLLATVCVIIGLIKDKSLVFSRAPGFVMMLIAACIIPLLGAFVVFLACACAKERSAIQRAFGFVILIFAVLGIICVGLLCANALSYLGG